MTAVTLASPGQRAHPRLAALAAALAGFLFGEGLELSGMTQPSKVVGFLDLSGAWDPSLAFVMLGAIGVHAILLRVIRKRGAPVFDSHFHAPFQTAITWQLVVGAALFGVGWGLSGFCPGPAVVSVSGGGLGAGVFVVTMVVGMIGARYVRR